MLTSVTGSRTPSRRSRISAESIETKIISSISNQFKSHQTRTNANRALLFCKLCPGRPEELTCEHTPHVNINGKDDMDDLPASRDKSELKSSRSSRFDEIWWDLLLKISSRMALCPKNGASSAPVWSLQLLLEQPPLRWNDELQIHSASLEAATARLLVGRASAPCSMCRTRYRLCQGPQQKP